VKFKLHFLVLFLLSFATSIVFAAEHEMATVGNRQEIDGGWKEKQGGITVVALTGDDYARGFQHGMLLRDEYREMLASLYQTASMRQMLEQSNAKAGVFGPELSLIAAMMLRPMCKDVPTDVLAELQGLADGLAGKWQAGADYLPLLVLNIGPDLLGISGNCSSIVVMPERGGETLLGRNLDMEFWNGWDSFRTIFVVKPDKGYAHVSLGWPGLVGVCSGMNEQGVALVYHIVSTKDTATSGIPIWFLNRKALLEADDAAKAAKILTMEPRMGGGSIVVLADKNGNAEVVELTAHHGFERFAHNGLVVASNHFFGSATREVSYDASRSSQLRYDRMIELAPPQGGPASPVDLINILRNNYDPDLKIDEPVGQLMGWDINLQSMVFAPKALRFWMADGEASAAQSAYLAFEYQPEKNALTSRPDLTIPANKDYSANTRLAVAQMHNAIDALFYDNPKALTAATMATDLRPDLGRLWVTRAWAEYLGAESAADFQKALDSVAKAGALPCEPWIVWEGKFLHGAALAGMGKTAEAKPLLDAVKKDGPSYLARRAEEIEKNLK
jgi:hypothetical protein